ncbi:hypothetical protein [Aedoeadaptatus urinae]|uniref:hypothetical protein n=1 Tax=Aedoeadaptatus urinae TaxID=1871017 RepID=UPI00097DED1C|nr:hypothetical protein [Peptoniphilus urinae]
MIQSSVLIQFLLSIIRALENCYKQSMLHGLLAAVVGAVSRQWKASKVRRALDGAEGVFARTLFFRILRFFYRLINTICHWVRLRITGAVEGSVGFGIADSYTSLDSALKVSGMASMGFGLSLIILGLLHRSLYGILGVVFLFGGLLANSLGTGLEEKIESSYVVSAVKSLWCLLLHDKEAESWKRE